MRALIIVFILLSKIAYSQEVRGIIVHKNQPIPFANIYVEGTSNGTFANSQGEFTLVVNSLKDTLTIHSNGYNKKSIVVENVLLNPTIALTIYSQKLNTVTVSSKKGLAKTIIKNVIKNRNQNDYFNRSFSVNLYTKSILDKQEQENNRSRDTMQLSLAEKYSKIDYSKGKWKETKLGIQDLSIKEKAKGINTEKWGSFSANRLMDARTKSNLFYTNVSEGNFNFYKSTILVPKLAQNPFISPLGPLALTSYQYSYLGSYEENEKRIYKLKVTPKRPKESVFKGVVQIEDSSWAIVAVELEMNEKNLHRYNSFKVYQRFSIHNEIRLLDRQEFFFHYTSGIESKQFHGTVYSKFTNYNFSNEKIKIGNLTQITVDSATNRSDDFWRDKRSIQLKTKEKNFIRATKKLNELNKSEKYIKHKDSLKNKTSFWEFTFTGMDHYNTLKGIKWKIDPLVQQARVFGIGGYRHALGGKLIKLFKNKNELFFDATINYGFKNKDLLSDGSIKYTYAPKRFGQFRLSGGNKYEMLTYMQNLSSLFSRGNFIQNDFIRIGHFIEVLNGLFLDVDLKYLQRSSIANLSLSKWSDELFPNNNQPIEFENYNEFNIKLLLSYTPFQKFAFEGRKKVVQGSKWPTFTIGWEQGIPDILLSKIDYQKVTIGFDHSFKIGLLGTSKAKSWYGQYLSTNHVEIPNYSFFRGTDNYFFSHPLYTFQLLGETYSSLRNYISFNYIHHFHGAICKKIPYLKKTKIEAVTGGGILYINDNNLQHTEIYNGLEIPFRLGETQLKFGGYYAIAYSNYSNLLNMFKFGLNVFNPFTNKWAF